MSKLPLSRSQGLTEFDIRCARLGGFQLGDVDSLMYSENLELHSHAFDEIYCVIRRKIGRLVGGVALHGEALHVPPISPGRSRSRLLCVVYPWGRKVHPHMWHTMYLLRAKLCPTRRSLSKVRLCNQMTVRYLTQGRHLGSYVFVLHTDTPTLCQRLRLSMYLLRNSCSGRKGDS